MTMRKVVVHPQTFVDTILKLAKVEQVHVLKWSSQYPQMQNHEWREYVLARMRIHQHAGVFKEVKFSPPDLIDDEWLFTATIGKDFVEDEIISPRGKPHLDTNITIVQVIVLLICLVALICVGIYNLLGGAK